MKARTACDCGKGLGDDLTWHCERCHHRIWRGAFRHWCVGGLVAEHAHDVDLWRAANPEAPCPCHEWGVGELRWGTFRSDPSGLVLPG